MIVSTDQSQWPIDRNLKHFSWTIQTKINLIFGIKKRKSKQKEATSFIFTFKFLHLKWRCLDSKITQMKPKKNCIKICLIRAKLNWWWTVEDYTSKSDSGFWMLCCTLLKNLVTYTITMLPCYHWHPVCACVSLKPKNLQRTFISVVKLVVNVAAA